MSIPRVTATLLTAIFAALALLTARGPDLQVSEPPEWDAEQWRSQLRAHRAGVEEILPVLSEVRAASDPREH